MHYPHPHRHGFTIFFTGLSGAGKTTLARALEARLMAEDARSITLLDGDKVRQMLSAGLGFSKADRDANIRRIGFVASEITKAGGMVIAAAIAPYEAVRAENRALISQHGAYIEVHVATPLAVCEARDPKGLYAKARAGEITAFTGVDDPYEPPVNPELTLDTSGMSVDEALVKILRYLQELGLIAK